MVDLQEVERNDAEAPGDGAGGWGVIGGGAG